MEQRFDGKSLAATLVALVVWASAFAGIRAGLGHYPGYEAYGPGEVALLRFLVGSAVLLVLALLRGGRLPKRRDLPSIVTAGFFGFTIYHVALNYGERTVTSGAAALIIATGPIFTALLASRMLGERLRPAGWIGIVASFVGVSLISFGEGGDGLRLNPDALLILVSAVATSLYFVMSKPHLRRYSSTDFTTYAMVAGTIPMLVFAPGLARTLPHAAPQATWAIVYMGVFPAAVAYLLWSYALARQSASITSSFLFAQPVLAALVAFVWLREVPGVLSIAGGTISLAGVVVTSTWGRVAVREPSGPRDTVAEESASA